MFGAASVVVQVEVEPGTQDTGEPAHRADAGSCSEMRDDFLDRPPSAQRQLRPLRVVDAGEVVGKGGALGVGGRPAGQQAPVYSDAAAAMCPPATRSTAASTAVAGRVGAKSAITRRAVPDR